MTYNGWNLLGGFRLLGGSLGGLVSWRGGFNTVGAFGMVLETGVAWVLANVKGLGGAGVLREPIDSNRSFPVMSTFITVLAALETLLHMPGFLLQGGQGAPPKKRLLPSPKRRLPLKFSKTIERTTETTTYCLKTMVYCLPPLKFFLAESQHARFQI